VFGFFRRRRHQKLMAAPFPPDWAAHLERAVPQVSQLSATERERLEDLMQIFLAEKAFEGAQELVVTDEMRVSVAAQACMLLLGHPETDVYPDLARVVLYPAAYVAKSTRRDGALVAEGEQVRLGESWDRGVVVLAWSAVAQGARNVEDGHNVVYHEFAHQLDQGHGPADGAPELPGSMRYDEWAKHLGSELTNLEHAADTGRPTLLDHYGATSPAEFFAVSTEAFFEKPIQMRERKPALYAQLSGFYNQDPAARVATARAAQSKAADLERASKAGGKKRRRKT
jgi:Mlc titration factor MtfA (ptsG expression regulator)